MLIDDPKCDPAEDVDLENNNCECLTDTFGEFRVLLRYTTQKKIFTCRTEQKGTL